MEELRINKNDVLALYKTGSVEQKTLLEKLYGKETFTFDWHEITSYEKACEVLGIQPVNIKETSNRPAYINTANAVQQLLTICEAINGPGSWYDEVGWGYYPVFALYTEEELQCLGELGEEERKNKGIYPLVSTVDVCDAKYVGVRCMSALDRDQCSFVRCSIPIRLNSEEKAEFVGKQFFELYCNCCGLVPKMD